MTNPAKLVQLIRKHGHEACVMRLAKTNGVMLHISHRVYENEGEWRREYEDIPATMPAVLAWLGY